MKCEICGEQTATMWVQQPKIPSPRFPPYVLPEKLVSCDDCGPQLGYKTLAPLELIPEAR